ncbi:MAG TPA: response regulator [Polyangia bacterium]|jgi:DNA-binding response OmpR family regulator
MALAHFDSPEPTRILVAHESLTIREAVRRLAEDAGYRVITAADGVAARGHLDEKAPPAVLVVDVALPKVLAYELCDEIRARKLPTRVILVASVYHRTAYKRRPTSLYGADDYIEQHHLPDALLGKIAALVPRGAAPRVGPPDPAEAVAIRQAGEGRLKLKYGSRDEALERARRLAALIVADVVLYNGEALASWRAGHDLPARVRDDLDEGRLLFELRVPPEVRAGHDFMDEALAELLGQRPGGEPHGA